MTRSVFSKTADKAHRTLLKKKYGVKTGTMTNITCFPVGYAKTLERDDVNRLAQKVLKRRTDLAWESFGQFSDDNGAICFTETVVDSGHRFYVCSCIEGVKGSKPCIHVLAMQIENGEREPVDITPMAKSVRKPGEILVNFAAKYLI